MIRLGVLPTGGPSQPRRNIIQPYIVSSLQKLLFPEIMLNGSLIAIVLNEHGLFSDGGCQKRFVGLSEVLEGYTCVTDFLQVIHQTSKP